MKDYMKSLINDEKRFDGRKLNEFRNVSITNEVSKNAEGSARVKIGDTEVIAGVKMATTVPYPDSPDDGTLMVTAEFLPMANPDFSAGPPSIQAIELARVIDRGIRESKMIDMKKLCITKSELVWMAFIDLYIINDDGNLIDAAALAAIAALKDAFMPKLDKENKVLHELSSKKLPILEDRVPLTCTVFKIGKNLFVDPVLAEEKENDARISIGISAKGDINSMQKGGISAFTLKEIDQAVEYAKKATDDLRKILK
jgi:exosome complex component RRP42